MCTWDQKRENFKKYLEQTGALENLTKALVTLYEEEEKPEDAIRFLRKKMCEVCPDEETMKALERDLFDAEQKITGLEREISHIKGNLRRTPSEIELALEEGFKAMEANVECQSLLKKYLKKPILDGFKELRTQAKGTILDCIQSGLKNPESSVGVYACDPEAYTLFADLFDKIIEDYHGFTKENSQPDLSWGDVCQLPELDPDGKYIVSTRVRCGRSVEGYPFNPLIKLDQYEEIRNKLEKVCKCFSGEYKGTFYELESMDKGLKTQLINDHYMYKEGDKYLEDANALRFWPDGRGIFVNDAKNFVIWCNEEDHLRIISMEMGGNLRNVYDRFTTGVDKLSREIKFARDERLGFLTFCPTNLGTAIRASVHIKLPLLAAKEDMFKEICDKHSLQVRGTHGEHSESKDGILDISNKKRMGLNEFDVIKGMADGILELIEAEKTLENEGSNANETENPPK